MLGTDILANCIKVSMPGRQGILVELSGEFDIGDLETLRKTLDGVSESRLTIGVDLSGVTFLDILCARELVERTCFHGGRLVIRSLSRQARISLGTVLVRRPGLPERRRRRDRRGALRGS